MTSRSHPESELASYASPSAGSQASTAMGNAEPSALVERITALFDEEIAYSISLTRLVDGESTYTLTVERQMVGEFPGYDEAAERLRDIKHAHRASAARQIMRELLVPARDELSRAADIVEYLGRADQAQLMRRRADEIRAVLADAERGS